MKLGEKAPNTRRPPRPAGGCGDCRWYCGSNYTKAKGWCMLDKGDDQCRFHATTADWEKLTKTKGRRDFIPPEVQERNGHVTELQVMRIGYGRFCLAQAASVLDRMPKATLPEPLLSGLAEITEALVEAEDWLYELQGHTVLKIRGQEVQT